MFDASPAPSEPPGDGAPTFPEAGRPDEVHPASHEVASTPSGLRARLVWIVVLALVAVALLGAAAAVLAAVVDPVIWVAVGAAAGWLVVLLVALPAVSRAVRPVAAQLDAERSGRVAAERAAWEGQWRDSANRTALEEQQRMTGAAVAQVNAALAESVRELTRVADLIREGASPEAVPPALPGENWPTPFAELQGGVQQLLTASFGVATLTASHQPVGVLITLARRLQPLIHRAIKELDALESQVEDPDLLNALFQLDHLVTRARRQAESIAVLGGATARQIRKPVPVYTVLRQAIAEIEHYGRVKVLRPVQGTIVGHAVTEVIHLIAELIENATVFSPPDSRVQVQVDLVPDGLSIEIDDLGLVMPADLRHRMNQLLTTPDRPDVGEQLKDGRIGLIVVAAIARRYAIRVRLERNERGGNRALIVLPAKLLAAETPRRTDPAPAALPAAVGAVSGAAAVGAVAGTASASGTAPATALPSSPAPSQSQSPSPAQSPAARAGYLPDAPPEAAGAPGAPGAPSGEGAAGEASTADGAAQGIGLAAIDRDRLAELGRVAFADVDRSRPPTRDASRPPAGDASRPAPLPHRGTAAVNPSGDRGPDPARPPLPRRDGQHMVPELRTPPPADAQRGEAPEPGAHNPGLFASYRRGRERADFEEPPGPPSGS